MKFHAFFKNVLGSLKTLQSGPIVIYYALFNNVFHTQLASAFVPKKDYVPNNTDAFFSSLVKF